MVPSKVCAVCAVAKSHRQPFNKHATTPPTTKPLELVYSDVCGPMSTPSLGGANYFMVIIDDYSGYMVVECLQLRSEVEAVIQRYHNDDQRSRAADGEVPFRQREGVPQAIPGGLAQRAWHLHAVYGALHP